MSRGIVIEFNRIIVIGIFILFSLFILSCKYPDEQDSLILLDYRIRDLDFHKIELSELWEQELLGHESVHIGDVLDDRDMEIILTTSRKAKILNLGGEEVQTFPLDVYSSDLFFNDCDGDGKNDLIFRLQDKDPNTMVVYNGLGRRLENYSSDCRENQPGDSLSSSGQIVFLGKKNQTLPVMLLIRQDNSLILYEIKLSSKKNSLLYKTAFNDDDGMFRTNLEDPTSDIICYENGELHLRAKKYEGFKSGAQARFSEKITRGDSIQFTVRFGEYFNRQHPRGHFNILAKNPGNRINLMVGTDWFGYFTTVEGSQIDKEIMYKDFIPGKNYSFEVILKNTFFIVLIDGEESAIIPYRNGLPREGYFIFESHNEYWVSDFAVYRKS